MKVGKSTPNQAKFLHHQNFHSTISNDVRSAFDYKLVTDLYLPSFPESKHFFPAEKMRLLGRKLVAPSPSGQRSRPPVLRFFPPLFWGVLLQKGWKRGLPKPARLLMALRFFYRWAPKIISRYVSHFFSLHAYSPIGWWVPQPAFFHRRSAGDLDYARPPRRSTKGFVWTRVIFV